MKRSRVLCSVALSLLFFSAMGTLVLRRGMQSRALSRLEHAIAGPLALSWPVDSHVYSSRLSDVASGTARWGATEQAVVRIAELLQSTDPSVKWNARAALHYLDHRANTTLLNLLGDAGVGGYVAYELANRKSTVCPRLTDILIHSADPERRAAAVVVFWLSAKSVGLTERDRLLLANIMRDDSSPKVRQASAFAVGDSADTFPTSVQSFIDAVNMDTNIAVVAAAAHSLGTLDCTQFGQVSDRLVDLLSSHDVAQRRHAVDALSWFPEQLQSVLPTLRSVLARDPDEYVKVRLTRLIDSAATQEPLEPAEVKTSVRTTNASSRPAA